MIILLSSSSGESFVFNLEMLSTRFSVFSFKESNICFNGFFSRLNNSAFTTDDAKVVIRRKTISILIILFVLILNLLLGFLFLEYLLYA